MPERPGEAGRFAVGWDGVVRPALAVGAKADLEADVRALAVVLKKSRESPQFHRVSLPQRRDRDHDGTS